MISSAMQQVLNLYNKGLQLYKERKFVEAKKSFNEALQVKPDDGPSKLYIGRCDAFIADPPPEDWDGVFVMKTK